VIHLYVLFSLGVVLVSTLIGYEKIGYAYFVLFCMCILVAFRLIFHVKRPFLTGIFFILLGITLHKTIQHKIQTQTEMYSSGFTYEDKEAPLLEGTLETFPSYRYSNNQYIFSIKNSHTKVLVYTQPYQKFSYLDTVSFSSSLSDVREEDPKWHMYYKKLDVQYVVRYPNVTGITHSSPVTLEQKILHHLFILKTFIRTQSVERFSSHTSALVLGMLLGEKDELSKEEKDMFNKANLSHILVVSGYNISLVISFIFLLLKPFHRYVRTCIALVFVFLFVLLVGHDASVVRSALMGSIIILAKIFNRQASAVHTLFLVAAIMLLIQPLSIFDAGFHLSFLATYSLLIFPSFKKIPEYIGTTLWVFLFICIYILYLSASISFVGILTNIFVLMCIPFFMLLSFVSLGFSVVPFTLSIDVLVLEIMSRYIFFVAYVAQFAPRFEYQISPLVTVGIYGLTLSIIGFLSNRHTTPQFIEKHYQKFVPQKPN